MRHVVWLFVILAIVSTKTVNSLPWVSGLLYGIVLSFGVYVTLKHTNK